MTKHTPGKWAIANYDDEIDGRKCAVVQPIYSQNNGGVVTAICPGIDRRANARLIAAAPDLLAALKWAVDQLAEPLHGDGSSYGRQYLWAKDAIAKARGTD